MGYNSFGKLFCLTSYGESHGRAMGGVLDGCPAGLYIDEGFIAAEMERRRPGFSELSSSRKEYDNVVFLSGIFENHTTGAPIAFFIENLDAKSKDYEYLKEAFRPSHGDYSYFAKYGIRDYRGGGRASARETAVRVAAGAIAKLFLRKFNIEIAAYIDTIGNLQCLKPKLPIKYCDSLQKFTDENFATEAQELILKVKEKGDSIGGTISCYITGVPAGLGEPIFHKIQSLLASAMLSIPGCKGFEIGDGFEAAKLCGSEYNDEFAVINNKILTKTNHSGGVNAGITNGMPVFFRTAFRPTATISIEQKSISIDKKEISLKDKGRHDPCIVPRAVPVVEAMAALVLADLLLLNKAGKMSH